MQKKSATRKAISGESYNEKETNFEPHVVEKTAQQKERIRKKLTSFLFSSLKQEQLEIIVNAMAESQYRANEIIIKQGDEGKELYVVESGAQKCSIKKVFTHIEAI
jgi:CRP-like cAMP-binding protein